MTEITDTTEVPEPGGSSEGKKPRKGGKRAKRGPLARLGLFYRQVIAELRKVVWPTRQQLSTYTSVVIVFVVIIIALVFVIDYGLTEVMKHVFG
ncbi:MULTISPECIES: preprotein translocase subunit SecE [Streptomyces]|uniref:Protein translocase subunit SecE n=1 Tax=Streptomyces qinglanensis TaxID=943816 RepID=A0A1E7KA54_9ACTN|nr:MULTISPECIES: preprotein translocase subunit SecE [Streptomyces]MBE9498110.1 preprotein translocase subunit SecE [Streptomyces sp. GKU 257-1]OEV00815.1 preprotein translocase subunit SecE [Streptomyces qinglanensis]OEV28589.1 preprotein translocase subunit SecE [Streptomyces nanshensis]